VHYDELSQQSVMAIADFAQKQGMKALRGVNAVADEAATSDKSANNANMRMTYGVYFYAEPMSVNPEQDSATQISKTDKNQDK
jgi:hypothetical protein